MSSKNLKVDFDVLDKAISNYELSIETFEFMLDIVTTSLDEFRTSGWDTPARDAFFDTFDNKWLANVKNHILTLKHFKQCLEDARNEYRQLEQLAKDLPNGLGL